MSKQITLNHSMTPQKKKYLTAPTRKDKLSVHLAREKSNDIYSQTMVSFTLSLPGLIFFSIHH